MGNSVSAIFRRALFALGALLAAGILHAQAQNPGRNINLIAANSTDHQIYRVTFTPPGGSTTVGNTDANIFVRPQSLAFVTNVATDQLDLLVADNQRGTIRRYAGAFQPQTPPNPTTSTVVF